MTPEFFILVSCAVPAAANRYVTRRRVKGNAQDAIARGALGEAARIHERCWDAVWYEDPVRARERLDRCALDLLNVASALQPELVLLLIRHHDSCLEAIRNRDAALGPVPRAACGAENR